MLGAMVCEMKKSQREVALFETKGLTSEPFYRNHRKKKKKSNRCHNEPFYAFAFSIFKEFSLLTSIVGQKISRVFFRRSVETRRTKEEETMADEEVDESASDSSGSVTANSLEGGN